MPTLMQEILRKIRLYNFAFDEGGPNEVKLLIEAGEECSILHQHQGEKTPLR